MANTAQAKKRARQAEVHRQRNTSERSAVRSAIKKVVNTLESGDKAQAQAAYPSKPITVIVPFAAGGATDSIARILSEPLSQDLGQQVVIETVGGAGGMIGADIVAKAAPDGYTLCSGASNTLNYNVVMKPDLPYSAKSFAPVIHMGYFYSALMVNAAVPARSLHSGPDRSGPTSRRIGGSSCRNWPTMRPRV